MSGRTVPRFALTGLLAATFAVPGVAQERRYEVPLNSPLFQFRYTLPAAPMPRAKVHIGEVEVDLSADMPMLPAPANAKGQTGKPCCGADCCRTPPAAGVDVGLGGRIAIPALGPVGPPLDVPLVRGTGDHKQLINFSVGLFGADEQLATPTPPVIWVGGPGCCRPLPVVTPAVPAHGSMPKQFVFGNAYPLQLVVANETCPTTAPNPLLGTWYRDMGVGMTAVTFTADEMKVSVAARDGDNTFTITATAHYTVTKDGLVYGAVTGADVDAKVGHKTAAGMELAELSLMLQELTDRPFSFRVKETSAGLMVSQLKAGSGEQIRSDELSALGGLYKFAKDGRVPTPTPPAKARETVLPPPAPSAPLIGAALGALIGTPTGSPLVNPAVGEPIQRIGVDFNIVAPPFPANRCEPVAAPSPVCNDAMKSMATDAFNQMLRPCAGGMTLPSDYYLNHQPQYVAPDAAFPLPKELAGGQSQPPVAVPAKTGPLGTWYREIGSKRCVVKVEPDHLTITVSEAHEFDGQTVTGHLTITADYHTARDGLTAVGIITGVDAKFDGDLPDDEAVSMPEKVADLQKALEDKPFAITFRRYGEALVIGNVRMPDVGDRMEFQPATYIGGRYKSVGDKPLAKLKAVKEGEPRPVPYRGPLPPPPPGAPGPLGGYYGPVPGGYGGPAPNVMLPAPYALPAAQSGELLPPQAVPYPAPARPAGWVSPPPPPLDNNLPIVPMADPTPVMPKPIPPADSSDEMPSAKATEKAVEPTTAAPQMPEAVAPQVGRAGPPVKTVTKSSILGLKRYASDPNQRMQQLLYASEDLGLLSRDRQPFSRNDQPSQITPERIHGGIY